MTINRELSTSDHQNLDIKNPISSDYDDPNIDSLVINSQLLRAGNIWITNSLIISDKRVKFYLKNAKQSSKYRMLKINHEFFKVTSLQMKFGLLLKQRSDDKKNFEKFPCTFFLIFKLAFSILIVRILIVNCCWSSIDSQQWRTWGGGAKVAIAPPLRMKN